MGYFKFWKIISKKRKFQIYIIVTLMIFVSIAEVVTVASVVPFLTSMTNDQNSISNINILKFLPINKEILSNNILLYSTLFVIFASLISGVLKLQLLYTQTKFGQELGGDISVNIYNNLLNQSYEDQIQINSSEKIATITVKAKVIIGGIVMPILNILSSSLISFSIFVFLIFLSPFVTLSAAIGTFLIYLIVSLTVKRKLSIYSYDLSKGKDKVQKVIQEGLGAIRDIIILNLQNKYSNKYNLEDKKLRVSATNVNFIKGSPKYIIETLAIVLIVVITYIISKNNPYSNFIPLLGALGLGLLKVLPLIQTAYSGWVSIKSNKDTFIDVMDMLEIKMIEEVEEEEIIFNKNIIFSNVSFTYKNKNKHALDDISLTINKGDFIGISGHTGSGKSTLLDLLLGLIDPTKGTIYVDDKSNIKKGKTSWYNLISHVPQSIFLFDNTLFKNITLEDDLSKIDEIRLDKAIKISNLTDLISSLEVGLETIVGEKGVFLSGGQRQRIGIARAIYQNREIILLDEGTNSLDQKTEESVYSNLNKHKTKDNTIILISHRQSSFKYCNKIFDLADGKIYNKKI